MKSSTFKLKPEDELIICCSSTNIDLKIKKKIKSLIKRDLDWNYILNLASNHKLMSLLYLNLNTYCAKNVPENILRDLNSFFYENAQKNLLLTVELVKVIELLKSKGINSISYKGPVLSLLAYKNIVLRQFNDVDILVDKSVAINSKDILVNNGYELQMPFKIDEPIYMGSESEYILFNKKNGVKVEINWKFAGNFFSFPQDPQILFFDLNKVVLNKSSINTFSDVNQILTLSIHAAKHNWSRLLWLCDISELIKTRNIDWDETIQNAEELSVKRILFINLFLTKDILELELPEEILVHINSDPLVEKISLEIKKRIFSEGNKPYKLLEKALLDIRKREKLFYGIKDCFNSLTRPSYHDFMDLPLPNSLFFLYYILRPFLLIKRYWKVGL